MKKYSIEFEGYYLYDFHYTDANRIKLNSLDLEIDRLASPGIYCIYIGKPSGENQVHLKNLIYIGKSNNIYNRLETHNKIEEFRKKLRRDERLYISFAEVEDDDNRSRIEAVLIFYYKPVCNTVNKQTFDYSDTSVSLSGDINNLDDRFEVKRTI